MAPVDLETFQWQTSEIIKCLLQDEEQDEEQGVQCRSCHGSVETDGPDDFDPVLIADKLRNVADSLNDDITFKATLNSLKEAAAQEAVEAAFSQGVEALCQTYVAQTPEVAPEMQLINASVALVLFVKKSSPELIKKVQRAMMSFFNRRVSTWVTQQGGWDKVSAV
ncbi:bcl-2-like protein 15 [Paralichthys olivaceus]|uniref:bcl-2-like protein 15 n=1 Tax=Paralichthys olivaceus TaxID=8255 RepID=UPI0037512406